MIYYPVLIPTLCRYEHFKRCVTSLSQCTHASLTELIIGLDFPAKESHVEGWKQIKKYISKINGFKRVTCIEHKTNIGAVANICELKNYAYNHYKAIIVTEDDNEFSPCFLDFLNKSLNKYWNDPMITSVCGYLQMEFENISDSGVLYTHDYNAWGNGQWKHKDVYKEDLSYFDDIWHNPSKFWKLYLRCPALANMFAQMMYTHSDWGDTMRSVRNTLEETYQVKPYKSTVRNWGNDGSGIHCSYNISYQNQSIISDKIYNLDDEVSVYSIPWNKQFFFLQDKNRFWALLNILKTAINSTKLLVSNKST